MFQVYHVNYIPTFPGIINIAFPWLSHGFPTDFLWIPMGFLPTLDPQDPRWKLGGGAGDSAGNGQGPQRNAWGCDGNMYVYLYLYTYEGYIYI